jgi:putative ABC transport system permease protein
MQFQVIGVLPSRGSNQLGMDQDDILLTPWTILNDQNEIGSSMRGSDVVALPGNASVPMVRCDMVDQIVVRVQSKAEAPEAIRQLQGMLREHHHIAAGRADDFHIRDYP